MAASRFLPVAIAGGIGAMIGRLLIGGPWPASAGDWVGLLALGVAVTIGVYVALRIIARRRQP